jgi:hypothetical protein
MKMNLSKKIEELEKAVNEIFNKPKYYILFKEEEGKYKHKPGENEIIYNSLDEFKQAVSFSSNDKIIMIEFV